MRRLRIRPHTEIIALARPPSVPIFSHFWEVGLKETSCFPVSAARRSGQ